jgi:hypothetical protein
MSASSIRGWPVAPLCAPAICEHSGAGSTAARAMVAANQTACAAPLCPLLIAAAPR